MSRYDDDRYPDDWGESQREFWDSQPTANPIYYEDSNEWERAQEAFQQGWMDDQRKDEHSGVDWSDILAAREEYYEISGTDSEDFDWEAWREFMGYGENE